MTTGWIPADWRPGKKGAAPIYRPTGTTAELIGGPLDGRHGHVSDASESLWVCALGDRVRLFLVRSADTAPRCPARGRLLGRYAYDGTALRWHPVAVEVVR